MFSSNTISVALLLACSGLRVSAQTTVTVSADASHAIPTSLWGQMYEDINHSGDGGLYAELLKNRAFQIVEPGTEAALDGWSALNGAEISVVADDVPLSAALPNSLSVVVPEGATGSVGFVNEGFWGIKVNSSWTYKASFNYRFPVESSFTGQVSVNLQTSSGDVLASEVVDLSGAQTEWASVNVTLTPSETLDTIDNVFAIVFDGESASGQTVNFALLSLFPPTFKDRENGMRIDVAEALLDISPAFFRFPGGNNLEGETVDTRWRWWETVGALADRPGRSGDWSYINTDGLGLLEYLYWCEDMEMEPFMAVYAGYSLTGDVVPEDELESYVQEALDQINFVIGDPATSEQAALRASLGREEPFALKYIEIGNEDWINTAPRTYEYRWTAFATAIRAAFPDLLLIATSNPFDPILDPEPDSYDVHVYSTPSWFADNAFYYDDFERNGTTYFEGEYAVTTNDGSNARLPYPTVQGSIGEAAFMTGLERNSDIVFAAAYAPLLNHIESTQWAPNLIAFDAGQVYKSTSFYIQKLFSDNAGDEYLPSTLPDRTGSLQWTVVRSGNGTIIIKVANTAEDPADITFSLPFTSVSSPASIVVITGEATAYNSPEAPDAIIPVESTIDIAATDFTYEALGYSFAVITFDAE